MYSLNQMELSIVEHKTDSWLIHQRIQDWYVNATELCQASNKKMSHYLDIKTTKEFLEYLSNETGIPVSGENGLIKTIRWWNVKLQWTWVHPDVAINLAQWLSPAFAVAVSRWIREWSSWRMKAKLPVHIERYMANRSEIPNTHFSMLNEMTFWLVAPLESEWYTLPERMVPDISMWQMFSKWVREEKWMEPKEFPTYIHRYNDWRAFPARLYPNELLGDFREYFHNTWIPKRLIDYFKKKDPQALPYLPKLLPQPKEELSCFNKKLQMATNYKTK